MDGLKKLALVVGEPDKSDQSQFMDGFIGQILQENMDVCVFGMHKMYQSSANREIGDSKIYNIIPYDSFEAIVVMADTIQTPGVLEQIEKELIEYFKGAVLFVDKESEYFPSVSMDDYTLTKDIISHLIDVHGYKDIAYLTGKSKNLHSIIRLQAYEDVLKEHRLPIRQDRIFYGDFWYTSGESMVEKLMKTPENLPRAIACANNCMAIGVAQALEKAGVKIPEQVAIVGFDSSPDGVLSPIAITAMNIPYEEFGKYSAKAILNMMEGRDFGSFVPKGTLFIGNSCGCDAVIDYGALMRRKDWETPDFSNGFLGRYNSLSEDIMCQNNLQDLCNMIFSYTYQLEDFESFHLCLNKYFINEKTLTDPDIDWLNYTDEMIHAIKAGTFGDDTDPVNLERVFETQLLLPDFEKNRKEPKVFFFSSLFYEEKCFGYSVISYGKPPYKITDIYPKWIAEVMLGIEAVRRQIIVNQFQAQIANHAYKDQMTGMRNYAGLKKDAEKLVAGKQIVIIAVDIKGLSQINKDFNREEGNHAIMTVASCVLLCSQVTLSACLGNDEFLLVAPANQLEDAKLIESELQEKIDSVNENNPRYQIEVCMGETFGLVEKEEDFDRLINIAVSQKNGNKAMLKRMQGTVIFTEEDRQMAEVVQDILTNNRFVYFFQPIINAKNGEIFAYEALMRSGTEIRVSPLDILKYAEALRRMEEVEKYTFSNVISYVQDNEDLFARRKVFINSIPGTVLSEEDEKAIQLQLESIGGQVVVELTEQAELEDERLNELKKKYEALGIDLAVDDYGTGYSNITNLLRYMPRYVKIDRMLLSEIVNSPQKQHFVNEIIEFAHANDIITLAEGIETAEELEMVIHLGVDLVQGYYVARPAAEVLQSIPVKVKREIHQFNLQEQYNKNRKLYVAGREFRVSIAKLVSDGYECIWVPSEEATYHDYCITGVPGNQTEMVIQIADGYRGRIELENVNLGGKRDQPCIQLGEDCDVVLVLSGENVLRTGGICVPETSRLSLEGKGDCTIHCNSEDYYGIGNDMDHGHGNILLEQQGVVDIIANSKRGVAIGAGLGGNIAIKNGKVKIQQFGKMAAAIGCLSGSTNILIETCDVFVNASVYEGVAIGAVNGSTKLETHHVAIICRMSGTNLVGMGAVHGKDNEISLQNGSFTVSINATKTCGVGSFDGKNTLEIRFAEVNLEQQGELVIGLGDGDKTSSLEIYQGDVYLDSVTDGNCAYGIRKDACVLDGGKLHFKRNGVLAEMEEFLF